MTHVITSLCLRDNACDRVCPVECIQAGTPVDRWPTYYIDPDTCIDCGACIPECPYSAIFPQDDVPAAYPAKGGDIFNHAGLSGHYIGTAHDGKAVILNTTRVMVAGEVVDLSESIRLNREFFRN
jgi:NAD-dependent dihydropyrimidine dehydrogenase PreA subunit